MNPIIVKEVKSLISIAEKLSADASRSGSNLPHDRVQELLGVVARGGQLITKLYGADSHFFSTFQAAVRIPSFNSMHSNHYRHVSDVAGILKAVESDLESGMLSNFKSLAQAEVFADFLDMAEHLLNEGYKDASAVLLGAVLEDSLRKIADAAGVAVIGPKGKPLTLDPLNAAVCKQGVYGHACAEADHVMGQSAERCSARPLRKVRRYSGQTHAFVCAKILRRLPEMNHGESSNNSFQQTALPPLALRHGRG